MATGRTQLRRMYADVEQAATAIWDTTEERGGGTFAASTGELNEYDRGFMVGREGGIKIAADENRDTAINLVGMFIQRQPSNIYGIKPNVGTWRHDGVIYVDAVDLYDSGFEAEQVARERGELAIWDNAEGREITII